MLGIAGQPLNQAVDVAQDPKIGDFAVLFGYLWFCEDPSPAVWIGLPLVIGSGLYILHRERLRTLRRPATAAA